MLWEKLLENDKKKNGKTGVKICVKSAESITEKSVLYCFIIIDSK